MIYPIDTGSVCGPEDRLEDAFLACTESITAAFELMKKNMPDASEYHLNLLEQMCLEATDSYRVKMRCELLEQIYDLTKDKNEQKNTGTQTTFAEHC